MRVQIKTLSGPEAGRKFDFDKPGTFIFGRAPDAAVALPHDSELSRHHFELVIVGAQCKVRDLGSLNGVTVNQVCYGGRRTPPEGVEHVKEPEVLLNDGDVLEAGKTRMSVSINTPHSKPDVEEIAPTLVGRVAKRTVVRPRSAPIIPGYTIEQELSHGDFARVYRAKEEKTGNNVVIKLLPHSSAADPQVLATFKREIEITRQLRHPHIVELIQHGIVEGMHYLVLEYVEGTDLAKLIDLNRGRIPLVEAAPIMLGALEGLGYAHTASVPVSLEKDTVRMFSGVVHRDLKPDNILLERVGTWWKPKLADFGISKSFESAGQSMMTMTGQLGGTPLYWPREQISHFKYIAPASDVFGIAAVFYTALTGARLRDGFAELEAKSRDGQQCSLVLIIDTVYTSPVVPIRKRDPKIPKPVADVIDRALSEVELPDDEHKMRTMLAEARYPDAKVFRAKLYEALTVCGIID